MSVHTVDCHSASERKDTDTCHGVGGPWKYSTEGKRPEAKGHMSPAWFHVDGMPVGTDIYRELSGAGLGAPGSLRGTGSGC